MAVSDDKPKRYVVLPSRGIADEALQTRFFRESSAESSAQFPSENFGRLRRAAVPAAIADEGVAAPPLFRADEFRVLSQRFEDGPALVSMTEAARWALEATLPGLRVVEVTQYYLPDTVPVAHTDDAAPTAAGKGRPAGQSALLASGNVFMDDARQYAMRGLGSSREGQDVLIGLVDTGVDASHPALSHAVLTLRSLIPGTPPGAGGPVDWGPSGKARAGHGTHVAGIVCAAPGHGGPPGVAPKSRVISYRVYPDNLVGPAPAENYMVIDAIRAAMKDGCHVINLSIEGPSLKEDGVRSAISDAWEKGVVCIAAAGNGFGMPVSYPAALPHCVAVTALGRIGCFPPLPALQALVSGERSKVDPDIFLATFSNFGRPVQFIAPGHAIVSTFPGNQWRFESGTSMSAPFVSGVLARALSDAPQVLALPKDATRSAAMIQLLVAHATQLGMPQKSHEGWGWPR